MTIKPKSTKPAAAKTRKTQETKARPEPATKARPKPATKAKPKPATKVKPATKPGSVARPRPEPRVKPEPESMARSEPESVTSPATSPEVTATPQSPSPATPSQKAGPFIGVIMTVMVFAGLVIGGGITMEYWWSYVEPLLPRSEFETDPRVTVLQDRVMELEDYQQEKDQLFERELSAFRKLEEERDRISQELSVVIARLESVESMVQHVEQLANAVSGDNLATETQSIIDELSERLRTMEVQNRESNITQDNDEAALAVISERIDNLEVGEAHGEGEKIVRASAMVLAVGQLRTVVREGRAYSAEFAAVVAASDDTPEISDSLDVLSRRAKTGVMQLSALRSSFEDVIVTAIRASSRIEGGGWINDILNKLSGLVVIRKIEGVAGMNSFDAQISRAESSLGDGDLVNVIGVIEKIEGPAAEAFDEWLEDARIYLAVEKALDDLYSHVIAQLSSVQE